MVVRCVHQFGGGPLNPSLTKTPGELRNELALATLTASKQQSVRIRALIERICSGTIAPGELKSAVLQMFHGGVSALEGEDREACRRLLLHVERHADLLSTATGALRWGRGPGNTYLEGVLALARHSRAWIRPVEDWRPESRVQYEQFASLARHLLARFEVPAFMDSVWFLEDGEEARRQQGWFAHIGAGGNVRTADVPIELTKKMAHAFLGAPEHCTVEEALRFGQVMGLGGSPALAEAVIATHLSRSFEHDEFWSRVVQFFARQSELEPQWVSGIVAYLHHRKFEPLGGGEPPEPNLSMKSRSLPKLMYQVERWRARWTREATANLAGGQSDDAAPQYSPYDVEEKDRWGNSLRWTITQLATARALAAEGEAMSHCIGSYADKLDKMSIWSLKVQKNDRVYHVLTISIDLAEGYISQVRGRFNLSEDQSGENRGRSKTRLSKREHRYLGAARDHLDSWLAREGIAYMQAFDEDNVEADRQDSGRDTSGRPALGRWGCSARQHEARSSTHRETRHAATELPGIGRPAEHGIPAPSGAGVGRAAPVRGPLLRRAPLRYGPPGRRLHPAHRGEQPDRRARQRAGRPGAGAADLRPSRRSRYPPFAQGRLQGEHEARIRSDR